MTTLPRMLFAAAALSLGATAHATTYFKVAGNNEFNNLSGWTATNGQSGSNPTALTENDSLRINEVFAPNGTRILDLAADLTIGSLRVDGGGTGSGGAMGAITINGGNTITLMGKGDGSYNTSGLILNSTSGGKLIVNSNLAIGANQLWTLSRALEVNGDVNLDGNKLTINTHSGSTTAIAGTITGGGILEKGQNGTVVLSGNNTYTGGTIISSGTIRVDNGGSLGTGTITNNATLTLNRNDAFTVTNAFAGSGTLNVNAGQVTYSGLSNNSGTINVNNATLKVTGRLFNGGYFGNGTVNVNSGGILELNNWHYSASAASLGGLSANQGRFNINGGRVRIVGTEDTAYGRAVTIGGAGATLEAASGADWTINTLDGGESNWIYNNNPTVTLDGAGVGHFEKILSNGSGALIKSGSGTWTLGGTGANTFTGGATVNGGTLVTAKVGALGKGDVNVVAGTLQIGDGTSNTVTLGAGADLLLGDGAVLKFFGEGSQITLASEGSYTFGNAALDLNGAFNAIGVYDLIIGGNVNLGTQGELTFLNFDHDNLQVSFSGGQLHVIPEPSTYGLMGAGALGAVALVRRRRKAAAKQ